MDANPRAAYREAYEATDQTLIRIKGLSRALYDLGMSHPVLGSSDPDSEAIMALIYVLGEKAERALNGHNAEWDLIIKPDRGLT